MVMRGDKSAKAKALMDWTLSKASCKCAKQRRHCLRCGHTVIRDPSGFLVEYDVPYETSYYDILQRLVCSHAVPVVELTGAF